MSSYQEPNGTVITSEYENDETILLTEIPMHQECISANEVEISNMESRFVPGRSRAADAVCLEPGCNFRCSRIPKLRSHLSQKHGIPQNMSTFRFETEEAFRMWLSTIEEQNHCSYMRRRGWQKNKNGSETACFYCNRGGLYISNASKKQSKQQGTCKTGVECTSSLKVTTWKLPSGTYQYFMEVEAYLQHYGHNLELGHTRIHWHDRKLIEEKLKNGISRHKILDEIRGSLDQTSDLSRIHLVSLQDIYNIEKRCGIKANRGRYCSEAGITAQAWIEAMQHSEENPVLLIKYQQEAAPEKYSCLGDDDFLLILQTPLQLKMLQKHGPRQFMCADVTHGDYNLYNKGTVDGKADGHEFHLFALEVLIPDENQNKGPYPVAWCVSNRKDGDILKVYFSCIKDNLKGFTLTPSYLFVPSVQVMQGDDWFTIWCNTFGAGPRKLVSSWHIIDEWSLHLKLLSPALFSSKSEKIRIMSNMETVLREPTVEHFTRVLDECISDLRNNEMTASFASYFEDSYMSQAESWASAYRTEAANTADAHLGIFHTRLSKHIYHEALKRKQLDILVKFNHTLVLDFAPSIPNATEVATMFDDIEMMKSTLMKYTRDNVLPKLRNYYKGKNEFHQRAFTAATHRDSMSLSLDDVSQDESTPLEWKVLSSLEVESTDVTGVNDNVAAHVSEVTVMDVVKVIPNQGCTARLRCPLRCSDCAACPHQMTCSCMSPDKVQDATISNDEYMCSHMHLVCRFLYERHRLRIDGLRTPLVTPPLVTETHTTNTDIKTDVIITVDGNANVEEAEIATARAGLTEREIKCPTNKDPSERELKHPLVHNESPKCKTIKIMKFDKATKFVFISSKTPIKLINKKVT